MTSSLVESPVGEFNGPVKGREKFWNRPGGAEAVLRVRAAVLSADDRPSRHFARRPGSPHRRRKAACEIANLFMASAARGRFGFRPAVRYI